MNKNRIAFIVISVLIITVELLLSTIGPMATLAKTTVIIAPIYNVGKVDEDFLEELTDILESHFVKTGSFTIVKQSRWEDYFFKHPDEIKEIQPYSDYIKITAEYGIEKLVTVSYYFSSSAGHSIHISLKDAKADIQMKSSSHSFLNLEELEESNAIIENYSFTATRVSIFDIFFIILLALQLLIVVLITIRKKPIQLIELTLIFTIILFLFSYFFAKNANMDYFQKFVAKNGDEFGLRCSQVERMFILYLCINPINNNILCFYV